MPCLRVRISPYRSVSRIRGKLRRMKPVKEVGDDFFDRLAQQRRPKGRRCCGVVEEIKNEEEMKKLLFCSCRLIIPHIP